MESLGAYKDCQRCHVNLLPRRLKSLQCGVLLVVAVNVLIFLSVSHRTTQPHGLTRESLIAGLLPAAPATPKDHDSFKLPMYSGPGLHGEGQGQMGTIQQGQGQVGVHQPSLSDKTLCGYRTTSYILDIPISLNQTPFLDYAKSMKCVADDNVAIFSDVFSSFRNVVIDPSLGKSGRRGGENMQDVWNQLERDEYFQLSTGYFKIPCRSKPQLEFRSKDHLRDWAKSVECYNQKEPSYGVTIKDFTLAIQRYEYVNLYHTMCDYYNAFVLMLLFGIRPSKLNILFVDAHPAGDLDSVWGTLFGNVFRAGHFDEPVLFHNLGWGMLGYFSPLNEHYRETVPYLEEFRKFFLTQHNVTAKHSVNCQKVNVVFIWRHNYVAHPRNQRGSVVRKFANEEEMLAQTQKRLGDGANVKGFQLDKMTMTDQLSVIAKTDILIGMHGAGLSHILFLPETSAVLELKPRYTSESLLHFASMAKWRKLHYSGWQNQDINNEKKDHKTLIPIDVLETEITQLYSKICSTNI